MQQMLLHMPPQKIKSSLILSIFRCMLLKNLEVERKATRQLRTKFGSHPTQKFNRAPPPQIPKDELRRIAKKGYTIQNLKSLENADFFKTVAKHMADSHSTSMLCLIDAWTVAENEVSRQVVGKLLSFVMLVDRSKFAGCALRVISRWGGDIECVNRFLKHN